VKELKELNAGGRPAQYEFFIQWHLTERCNLSCRHCYQPGGQGAPAISGHGPHDRLDEMSLEEISGVAEEVARMLESWAETYAIRFSPSFNITGGEPLLRRDLFDVLGLLGKTGFEIYLLTNGTLIDRAAARAISSSGVGGVQVSIEGPKDVHDAVRGKGSFQKAVNGVRNLMDFGCDVTLNLTLSRLNSACLDETLGLAEALGVKFGFSRLVPSGRGKALLGEMLGPDEVKGIYEYIVSKQSEGMSIVSGDPLTGQGAPAISGHGPRQGAGSPHDCGVAFGGCAAGVSGLTIMPDGTVTPCRRLPLPLGNVRKDSLRELWAASPVLAALRDAKRYKGKCGQCPRWSVCRGCRAIAYARTGDFLAEDPQCFI